MSLLFLVKIFFKKENYVNNQNIEMLKIDYFSILNIRREKLTNLRIISSINSKNVTS